MSVCGEVSLLHPFRLLSLRRGSDCSHNVAVQKFLQIKCFHLLFMQGGRRRAAHLKKLSRPASRFKEQSRLRFTGAQKGIQSHPLWIIWYEPVLSVIYLSAQSIFKKLLLVWHCLLSKKAGGVRKPWVCFQPLTQLAAWHTVNHFSFSSALTGRTVSQCILSFMLPICSVLCFFGQEFPLFLQQGM